MQNFICDDVNIKRETQLKGEDGKRIVKIANLRNPKNHLMLLNAFLKVQSKHPDWTLHLIGKDYKDSYSKSLHDFIKENSLENKVIIHGVKNDISNIISQATIGVISSTSEGLPMALLEYGYNGLGIITTNVGKCADIVNGRGVVLKSINPNDMEIALNIMIEDDAKRKKDATKIKEYINNNFTEKVILDKIVVFYKSIT